MLTVIAFSLLAGRAHAGGQSTIKATLQAHYDAYSRAFATKDMKFLNAYFTPGYTVVLPTKEVKGREDVLKAIDDVYAAGKNLKWTFKVLSVGTAPDGVLAHVQSHFSARVIGDDKKSHKAEIDGVNDDVWSPAGKDWAIKRTTLSIVKVTMDGKVIPPPPGFGLPSKPLA